MQNISIKKIFAALYVLASGLMFGACSPIVHSTSKSSDITCSNNLARIAFVLRDAVGPSGAYYPKSLKELSSSVNANLFICPENGGHPGPISEIENWTDFIYVGNLTDAAIMHVALVISPPENHGGTHGYVLFSEGIVLRLPSQDVYRLIRDPFLMATLEQSPSNSTDNIAHERARAIITIPKKLKAYYTNRIQQ